MADRPVDGAAEQERLMLDAVARFLEKEVAPHAMRLEHDDVYPTEIVEQMKEMGLFGATIAEAYGGLGMALPTYVRVIELIAREWMSLTGIINTHLIMAYIVERHGTEAQKASFLPRFAKGELRGGLALTEPDCGTDLQAIRTVARRAGDHYVVNGTKTWISNGIHGQCVALLVKTDPQAEPRHKGMSMLLAEKGPGFTVGRKLEKLGYKGIDSRGARVRGLSGPGRSPDRRGGRQGLAARPVGPRARPGQHRRPRGRRGPGSPRRGRRLQPDAPDLRQGDP